MPSAPQADLPLLNGHPIWGMAPELRRDAPAVLADAHQRYGDQVRLRIPGRRSLISLAHPEDIRTVLVEHNRSVRRSPFHDRLRPVLGDGLLTSDPPLWNKQKAALQPAFRQKALWSYAQLAEVAAAQLATDWRENGTQIVDAEMVFSELALDVAVKSLFGPSSDVQRLSDAVTTVRLKLADRMFAVASWPLWVPTPANRSLIAAMAILEAEVHAITEAPASNGGIIQDLAAAVDMAPQLIRDEVMTLLLAGHESTAVGLSWTMLMLAGDTAWQDRVAKEATKKHNTGSNSDDPLNGLTEARAVVMETLRLFPPAAWFARRVAEPIRTERLALAHKDVVLISPWVVHRDRRWWSDPETFRPERFLDCAKKPRPLAYLPFGAGPRTCIGLQFALNELTVAVSTILRGVAVEALNGPTIRAVSAITLHPVPSPIFRTQPRTAARSSRVWARTQ